MFIIVIPWCSCSNDAIQFFTHVMLISLWKREFPFSCTVLRYRRPLKTFVAKWLWTQFHNFNMPGFAIHCELRGFVFTLSSVPYCSENSVKRLYVQLPSKSSWGCGVLANMHCKQKLARWGSRGSTVARAIGCPADARVFESPASRELENRNSVLGCRIDPT